MDTLLFKWVIRALKLGNSNLKLLLCFKLAMCKSSKHMKWGPKVNWALVETRVHLQDQRYGGISKAWKWMAEKLDFHPPQAAKAIKRASTWWGSSFRGSEFGLSIPRVQELYKSGLHTLRNLWRAKTKDFHS